MHSILKIAKAIPLAFLSLLLYAHSAQAKEGLACKTVEITSPKKASQVADSKPEIHWQGNPQETYRVQVALILPEGRILDSIDTQVVGTRWAFGSAIPVQLAAIKVLVSQNCSHFTVQDLNAAPPQFFYDARAQCAIEPMSLVQTKNTLRWKPVAQARNFAITLFEATTSQQGKLVNMQRLDRIETTELQMDLNAKFHEQLAKRVLSNTSLVASVQAQCGVVWSQPQAVGIIVQP
jgi:hypothetical protein